MNNWVGIGNVVRKPELSYTQNSNVAKCVFTLAINRPKRNGEEQGADYIRIITWNRQAETCNMYLDKGSKCAVAGSIRTGSYTNREGQKVYTTDVWAERVEFLDSRNERPREPESEYPTGNFELPESFSAVDDPVPFDA